MPDLTRAFDISNELPALGLRASEGRRGLWRILRPGAGRVGVAITGGLLAVALLAGRIAPADPFASVGPALAAPTLAHPMGTDDLGRDVLSGVVYGTRTSLLLALLVSLLSGAVGIAVGSMAAWQGWRADDALMRFTEFVQAARSLGAGQVRILLRDVLPNALPPVVVVLSLSGASVILIEAGLSFLGLGDPDVVSLGYLANNAQRFLRVAWWMAAFPGAAIALAVIGLNLLGDGLNEALNPRGGR